MTEFENSSAMAISTAGGGGESSISRPGGCDEIQMIPLPVTSQKKKRNLPGMPDPDSIVLALSPKTLLATNRFLCEICNKGFQRDQNLQLHRRGHNLPWKLKQRTSKEIRKKVYVCPEPTCVHHNPARALGDLTGIKKHFSRKHGEKKYKCERCSKKYAVQSDWKAHMKTCGTREYKCDCGTIFSRRDSFITHRAFCDALAEESARTTQTLVMAAGTDQLSHNKQTNAKSILVSSPPPPPLTPSTGVMSPSLSIQSSEVPEIPMGVSPPTPVAATSSSSTPATSVFASVFASSAISTPSSSFSNQICALARSDCPSASSSIEPTSLSLSSPSLYLSNNGGCSSLFSKPDHQDHHMHYAPSPLQQPAMSATALLQKAAQMGATSSNPSSFFQGLGGFAIPSSTSSSNVIVKQENNNSAAAVAAAGLGLGLSSGLNDVMNMDPTLDLLGLGIGIGASGAPNGGLSALLSSFNGDFNVGPYGDHDHHQRSGSPPERPWSTTTGVHKRNHPNGPP